MARSFSGESSGNDWIEVLTVSDDDGVHVWRHRRKRGALLPCLKVVAHARKIDVDGVRSKLEQLCQLSVQIITVQPICPILPPLRSLTLSTTRVLCASSRCSTLVPMKVNIGMTFCATCAGTSLARSAMRFKAAFDVAGLLETEVQRHQHLTITSAEGRCTYRGWSPEQDQREDRHLPPGAVRVNGKIQSPNLMCLCASLQAWS